MLQMIGFAAATSVWVGAFFDDDENLHRLRVKRCRRGSEDLIDGGHAFASEGLLSVGITHNHRGSCRDGNTFGRLWIISHVDLRDVNGRNKLGRGLEDAAGAPARPTEGRAEKL